MDYKVDIDEYMKRFRVFNPETLFEPEWNLLKLNRCPLCGNLMKFTFDGKSAYCSGKKHRKRFFLSMESLEKIKERK